MKFPISFITRKARERFSATIAEQQQLQREIAQALTFIENITQGKLDTDTGISDSLNSALMAKLKVMQAQMQKIAQEEYERNWTAEGVAKISEILQNHNASSFYDDILSNLVKYLDANQGALFIVNSDESSEISLEMLACYAYQKKKYLTAKIGVKEGLVGQCYLEKESILLKKIPENYVRITSGLGESTPSCLLLVPLKVEEKVLGIIELASFKVLPKYRIDFVEKIAENIGNAIANLQMQIKTKSLLELSQQQTEEMRAQEEEMRQNMEELEATQEEMTRKDLEMRSMLAVTNITLATVEFDMGGHILIANQAFLDLMGYEFSEIQGKHHRIFVEKTYAASEEYRNFWHKLNDSSGEYMKGEFARIGKNGKKVWLKGTYSAILDMYGVPYKVVKYAQDITEIKQLQEANEEANEELRQNMEEMQTIQEDLRKRNIEALQAGAELNARVNALNAAAILSESDVFGNILYVNDKLLEITGYTREELIGKPHSMLRHPSTPKEVFAEMWRTIKAGKVFQGVYQNRKKDGSAYWVEATIAPVIGADGKPEKYVGIRFDVTAAKEAEIEVNKMLEEVKATAEELRAQEEELRQNIEEMQAVQESVVAKQQELEAIANKYEQILEGCADAVVMIDNRGTVSFFNAAAEKLWSYHRSEVIGENVKMLMGSEHAPNHDQYLHNYKSTGIAKVLGSGRKVDAMRKDKIRVPILLTLSEAKISDKESVFTAFVKDLRKD